MSPIKVGFIGLSSTQSWAVWAHLPYFKNTSKYEIVALCNSSADAAKTAIKTHGLDSSIKAYGTAYELAADPNVELVVCCVRVDKHYDALMPALKAGKDVFCEWPLAENAARAEELLTVAKEKGVKTLIGLQARQSPAIAKIRSILHGGTIGKFLSTTFHATPKFFGESEWEELAYQNDRDVGGNLVTIYGIHSLEAIQYAIGTIDTFSPVLAINHPTTQLTTYDGKPTKTAPRTSHDQFLLQGTFSCGSPISYHLRGGPAFGNNDNDGLLWRLYGSRGEVQVTGSDSFIHISDGNLKIELFDRESGKVEEVKVGEVDEWSKEEFPLYAKNIARLYDGFAAGKGAVDGVLGWEEAVERHQFVEEVYKKAGVN